MSSNNRVKTYFTIGRRKKSTARLMSKVGSGIINVNGTPIESYFTQQYQIANSLSPLTTVKKLLESAAEAEENENIVLPTFDITVKARGGGCHGQSDSIKLGIARLLLEYNEDFKPALRKAGHLTRDSRATERKKPGLVKARKRQQFKKR